MYRVYPKQAYSPTLLQLLQKFHLPPKRLYSSPKSTQIPASQYSSQPISFLVGLPLNETYSPAMKIYTPLSITLHLYIT